MNVKFKIQQKRDKFIILKFEKTKVIFQHEKSTTSILGKALGRSIEREGPTCIGTTYEWSEGEPVQKTFAEMDELDYNKWIYSPTQNVLPKLFDSYEEAEDYIFQEYGWNGWGAIQEPEWKTV